MKKHVARVKGLRSNSKTGHEGSAVDKGHENMLNSFVDAIIGNRPSPCDEISGYMATYLAKLAIKSIETRQAFPVLVEKIMPCIV